MQYQGMDNLGNVCAVGALSVAEGEVMAAHPWFDPSTLKVMPLAALTEATSEFGDYRHVPSFNDDPKTTKQDVLNCFDKAIASLEEKGL